MSNVYELPMNYRTRKIEETSEEGAFDRLCEFLDMEDYLGDGEKDEYLLWEAENLCKQLSQRSLEKLLENIKEMI